MKKTIKGLLLTMAAMLFAVSAYAQVTTSSMSGKVTDSNGAVVGAVVVATYTPNGAQFHAISDVNGNYRILNITPGGPYTVEVQMMGYATSKTEGIAVALADNYVHNVDLHDETLSLKEVVVVADGKLSNMRSDRSGAITSVSGEQISKLPTVSRSMNDVMKLSPQASSTSNGIAIGGGNYRQSYVTVDGASFNNSFGMGGNLPAGGSPISLDALDQMAISITPYDVRQSGFTGGSIQTTTKSGSNEFHVSVYDYYTSDKLKGAKYGNEGKELTLPKSLNNTVGINVSGPIVKNKLFYFVNFEYDSDVVPGNTRLARPDESTDWGKSTQYNRPTVSFMNEVKDYLQEKYGYDPGRYADYSASTPDWKLFARVDWLINNNNKLTARFSKTMNKYTSAPSSSVSGLKTVEGYSTTRNNTGRISNNALYFENNRYFQEQNYTSFAAELNSRLLDGAANNILRVTYSKQYEPRSYVGNLFPTVDIFGEYKGEATAVMTSFGLDPFTYGNLRDVANVVVTDEFSYVSGIHTLIAGASYEYNKAINGYMQGGAGYYSFNSWADFKNEKPSAFSIMYGNNENMEQTYPSLTYHQIAAYVQDEMSVSDRFKLTAGLRLEMPVYPEMAWNENKDFTKLMTDNKLGYKTCDTPKAVLSISPRVGFNWDVTGDRKVIVRGGTGIFTGRLPMVWLVSAVGNSNVLQNSWGTTDAETISKIGFHTNPNDIIAAMNKAGISNLVGELAAPRGATILDKNLKMPQTWKSSLAVDFRLPGDVKATVEGIYNKDLRTVYAYNAAKVENSYCTYPGEPADGRQAWKSAGFKSELGSKVDNIYYLTNAPVNGSYYSIAATLSKDFNFGLSASVSYARSGGMSVNEGIGDQISSAWNTNTFAVGGSNSAELGYGSYVSPNRLIANVSYRIDEGHGFATTLGLFYEGYNFGYANGQSYSYTRYSYTFSNNTLELKDGVPTESKYAADGSGGAYNLMYIPTDADLAKMTFKDEENKAAFKSFIEGDKYLSSHRGEYSVRGAGVMPWHNAINFKLAQDIAVRGGDRYHKLQIGVDVNNIANLLNPKWGNVKYLSTETALAYVNDKIAGTTYYSFTKPEWFTVASTASTWSALLSVRYIF